MKYSTKSDLKKIYPSLRSLWHAIYIGELAQVCELEGKNPKSLVFDFTDLPVYGGNTPKDTHGVWSWDRTHLMVSGAQGFELVKREEV